MNALVFEADYDYHSLCSNILNIFSVGRLHGSSSGLEYWCHLGSTHTATPPLVLFHFSSKRIFQKSPPLGPTQRILPFLWKIKLCNLLLDPSEPTPPSLSLFIDSTALQWEKNSQADGLAQKNIKKVHSRYKELKRRNSNICSERYLMEIARLLSKPRAPSLASPSYQSTPLPSMCAYTAYTAINISTIKVCIRSYPKYVHSMNFNAPPLIRVPFCIVKYADSIIFINMCIKRLDLRVQRIQQM